MNRIALFMSTFIVAILVSVCGYAATMYTVKKGDNPYTIAKKFRVSVDNLVEANAIDPARLAPGTRITIPSQGKKERIARAQDTRAVKESAPLQRDRVDVLPSKKTPFHIVKKGDTLSSLSKRYSVPQQVLVEINDLRSSRLRIGQRIVLNRSEAMDYNVRKGDTIWNIARRFDLDPNELIEINGLESSSLKLNQKILLKRPAEREETHRAELRQYETILSQSPEETESVNLMPEYEIEESGLKRLRERLVLFAHKMLDIPYRFGGNSLFGIDCSAYVKKVYSMIGIDLPRSAREQFEEGIPVDEDNLSIGDLVFFRTYASYPSHVGIYLGNNLFIHASSKKKRVTIDSLDTPFYLKRFIGAKRLLDMSASDRYLHTDG